MVISNQNEAGTVITLLPNQSADWAQTRLFVLLICGTTLAIGLFWTFAGAWAVLEEYLQEQIQTTQRALEVATLELEVFRLQGKLNSLRQILALKEQVNRK